MDISIVGAAKSSDNNQVHYVATDPKASYTLTNSDVSEQYSPACIDWVSPDRVNFNVLPPEDQRDKYKGHKYYKDTLDFCENWDQKSFDPNYKSLPLKEFEPLVRKIFSRKYVFLKKFCGYDFN